MHANDILFLLEILPTMKLKACYCPRPNKALPLETDPGFSTVVAFWYTAFVAREKIFNEVFCVYMFAVYYSLHVQRRLSSYAVYSTRINTLINCGRFEPMAPRFVQHKTLEWKTRRQISSSIFIYNFRTRLPLI